MGRILGPDELRNCEVVGSQVFTDSRQLLSAVFCTSTLGFAIFDRQLRFQAINGSLASINGVPAKAHLGKTPFQIFGNAAEMGELKIQHVLATGQRLLNYEYSGKIPNRSEVGHWIVNYFPIKSQAGKINRVCVTVSEVTKLKKLEELLRHRSRNSAHVDPALKGNNAILPRADESRASGLSPREREIIQLVANDKANKEIGAILDISVRTVETHRARIMYKLGLHSVTGLVLYAVRNNIIQP